MTQTRHEVGYPVKTSFYQASYKYTSLHRHSECVEYGIHVVMFLYIHMQPKLSS